MLIGLGMFAFLRNRCLLLLWLATLFGCGGAFGAPANVETISAEQFQALKQQNDALQKQIQSQQKLIDSLAERVAGVEQSKGGQSSSSGIASGNDLPASGGESASRLGKVAITGEGAVGMFRSEENGQNNKPTFRIDEAYLYLDAPVWNDVYFYSEIDLATRESTSLSLNVGELYLEFEDVSKLWNKDEMLNIRVGRMYIPFGEEYLNRFAMKNPLISHSISDLWGTDDGLEAFGTIGPVKYVAAVQNGGIGTSTALQSDKSVVAKLGYDPAAWMHMSVSGMRTGNLNVNNGMSAIWFGNGFFKSMGSRRTTSFHDNLVEGDVQFKLPWMRLSAFGGYVNYGDNDPAGYDHRDLYYYSVEAVRDWTSHFYTAARWSQVLARDGFPIVANGSFGEYEYGKLTTDYWRLSLGLGYRFSRNLVVKGEYTFNHGDDSSGGTRTSENSLAIEAAFDF